MQNILHGPTEIGIGILSGFIGGFLCACFPHRNEVKCRLYCNSIVIHFFQVIKI